MLHFFKITTFLKNVQSYMLFCFVFRNVQIQMLESKFPGVKVCFFKNIVNISHYILKYHISLFKIMQPAHSFIKKAISVCYKF